MTVFANVLFIVFISGQNNFLLLFSDLVNRTLSVHPSLVQTIVGSSSSFTCFYSGPLSSGDPPVYWTLNSYAIDGSGTSGRVQVTGSSDVKEDTLYYNSTLSFTSLSRFDDG